MNSEQLITKGMGLILEYGPGIVGAILVLVAGLWLIRAFVRWLGILLEKRSVDESLRPFIKSLASVLLKVLLVVSVLGMIGIEMTSFIAILGAAGLAVGMALSGTLQNFAGGVMILLFKPFKAGDFIEAQGYSGTVHAIQIFNTILKTPDNKTVIIPNGGLSNASMTNYSTEAKRRVDWTFGTAYGDDPRRVRKVLKRLCSEDSRILDDPEVFVALSHLADSSVNYVMRAWVDSPDYWPVFFEMQEKVYQAFAKEGLNIPYPQLDVHILETRTN